MSETRDFKVGDRVRVKMQDGPPFVGRIIAVADDLSAYRVKRGCCMAITVMDKSRMTLLRT